jgi:hypothetical protein
LAIDVATIVKLKQSLDEKSDLVSSSAGKKEEQARAKLRSIVMIVLNSLANFVFRFPELVFSLFLYYSTSPSNRYVFKILCYGLSECMHFVELAIPFYTLSLSFNFFFFYYFFNRAFKFSFQFTFSKSRPK